MPSVRYAPTNSFINHISGVGLERVRLIIIDNDLNSAFWPTNLAVLFRDSDRMRRYQVLQAGVESKTPIVTSSVLARRSICTNMEQKGFCQQNSVGTGKDGIGYEQEKIGQEVGDNFLANLHFCYHYTQVSNTTKFFYWSHGPTYGYILQATLLFKELKDTYTTTKFDSKQGPHASVFMCYNYGRVERLDFGDVTVSGLELISPGEPIGNMATHGVASSLISLATGSNRAGQILDTLMVKTTREILWPQWDTSLSSAVLSSPQSDEGFLMMKSAFPSKKTWKNRYLCHSLNDSSSLSEKQLVRTKATCQITGEFHTGLDNQPSQMFSCPEDSYHCTLNWVPSKAPTRKATKIGTKATNPLTRGPSKNKKQIKKNIELVFFSTICSSESKTIMALQTLPLDESRKLKKVCGRLPRLSYTHPNQKPYRGINTGSLNIDVITGAPGNTLCVRLHDDGTPEGTKEPVQLAEETSSQKQGIDINLVSPNAKCDVDRNRMELPTDRKLADIDSSVDIRQALGCCKEPLSYLEPHMPNAPNHNIYNSDPAHVSGGMIPGLRAPKNTPIDTFWFGDKKPAIYPRFLKFDLRGLPYTCVPSGSPVSDSPQGAPPTSPHIPSYATLVSDDPIFNNCIIRRGFYPIYPSKETPKMEFENRIGGLQSWYKWPPVQVAREYLPRGAKEADWSWTNNGVSGEFIPGGIAW